MVLKLVNIRIYHISQWFTTGSQYPPHGVGFLFVGVREDKESKGMPFFQYYINGKYLGLFPQILSCYHGEGSICIRKYNYYINLMEFHQRRIDVNHEKKKNPIY